MAWIQLLEAQGVDNDTVGEMQKDVKRLETVTNRFSKIGSETVLDEKDINLTIENTVEYFSKRISSKVALSFSSDDVHLKVAHNRPLMEWVLENLIKNAVDAMRSDGKIHIRLSGGEKEVFIDVADTGKGMTVKVARNIFKPGYTTKKRGWGLGLSLVKRIITEYHKGKIFVWKTEPEKGTTFRIVLNR